MIVPYQVRRIGPEVQATTRQFAHQQESHVEKLTEPQRAAIAAWVVAESNLSVLGHALLADRPHRFVVQIGKKNALVEVTKTFDEGLSVVKARLLRVEAVISDAA